MSRVFRALRKRLALPAMRPYDLRHTAATLALEMGEHPKVVQEMMGHSSINITLDVYSHVTPDMQDRLAARMDSLLGGAFADLKVVAGT